MNEPRRARLAARLFHVLAATTAALGSAFSLGASGPQSSSAVAASNISYTDGQLSIDMVNTTIGEVLSRVAALTGTKVDFPPDANNQRIPIVKLGPGPPRQVLASLLNGSRFAYLIQASDSDPNKLQSVLLLLPDEKSSKESGSVSTSPASRNDYINAASRNDQLVEAPAEVAAPGNATTTVSDADAASAREVRASAFRSPPQSSNTAGALSPPSVITSENINKQLQQMYQQRMQMLQQDRQAVSSSTGNSAHN